MKRSCSVVFWDVQHGHSTYIKTPNNRHIVIDLGIGDYSGRNSAFSPLRYLKANYGVNQLDYVVITHPHLDHIDDILNFDFLSPKVLLLPRLLTNAEVMEGVIDSARPKFEKYCEIKDRYNESVVKGSLNDTKVPENWGGLSIQTFTPIGCSHDNFNNFSIVTVIEFAFITIVIPGDNQKDSFEKLMLMDDFKLAVKDADILLAPHHGRESGYLGAFVDLVNPRLTVVSDGRFCDTSANARYSAKSRGWTVFQSNGTSQDRYCLTTNTDGEIFVEFGYGDDNTRFLSVKK